MLQWIWIILFCYFVSLVTQVPINFFFAFVACSSYFALSYLLIYEVVAMCECAYMCVFRVLACVFFAVLSAVRIVIGLYQLNDQLWLVKHWLPFFVQQQKQRFLFVRLHLIVCIFLLVLAIISSSTSSWQDTNDIFTDVYYIGLFVVFVVVALWYVFQGGVDCYIKYRYHCAQNIFLYSSVLNLILGIVGLIIGDGGGNALQNTLNYHSIFVTIYFAFLFTTAMIVHRFVVVYEELTWKHPNPILATTFHRNAPTTTEAANGLVPAGSNIVACNMDVSRSSNDVAPMKRVPHDGVVVAPSENYIGSAVDDTNSSNEVMRFVEVEEDGKETEEIYRGLVSQSAIVPVCDAPSSGSSSVAVTVPTRAGSINVSYLAHRRRNALTFDGILRTSTKLRSKVITHQIIMVKLKRHELVRREIDKLFCILYQMVLWETVMWVAQTFVQLYLQSINTPTLSGQDGYDCLSPLENTINSAQFAGDLVFARR